MHTEPHSLVQVFPEHAETLHALTLTNPNFARLCAAYHELDQAIGRAEDGAERVGADTLETLKQERQSLKDRIYSKLTGGGCGGHGCSCGGGI